MAKYNHDDISHFHEYSIHGKTRTIFMGSEMYDMEGGSGVDGMMAERTIKNLHLLETASKEPITILMDNIGGDEFHCFAIIDAILACESHITIKALGHAMSCGSLILQAADRRIMGRHSRQMLHYGTWACNDHSKTFQKWAKEGERIDHWMEQWYLAKIHEVQPNFSLARLRNLLDHDTFLTADESIALGLADEIL